MEINIKTEKGKKIIKREGNEGCGVEFNFKKKGKIKK